MVVQSADWTVTHKFSVLWCPKLKLRNACLHMHYNIMFSLRVDAGLINSR